MNKKMNFNSSFAYVGFLTRHIIVKKTTYILPIITFLITLIVGIIVGCVVNQKSQFLIISYVMIIFNLLMTTIFASLKALNVFKDFSEDGIDILVISKPISRKNIVWSKIFFFILTGVVWSLISFLGLLIFYLISFNFAKDVNYYWLLSYISPFICYLVFGLLTSLLALKLNAKISVLIPLVSFVPLLAVGIVSNIVSQLQSKAFLSSLKQKPTNNIEPFYLNNNLDQYYLINTGFANHEFKQSQNLEVLDAYLKTRNLATFWQVSSWIFPIYQLVDAFNKSDYEPFSDFIKNQENHKVLYANNLASKQFNYRLEKNSDSLPSFNINNDKGFLVPSLLKNDSQNLINNNLNQEVIYAIEDWKNQTIEYQKNSYTQLSADDIVGSIKWTIIKEVLNTKLFNEYANNLFKTLDKKASQKQILDLISNSVQKFDFNKQIDENTELFKKDVNKLLIKSKTERQIYLAISLIYYLYFSSNYTDLLNTLLFDQKNHLQYQTQFKINLNNKNYLIGGFKNYLVNQILPQETNDAIDQSKKDKKIRYKYSLEQGGNYLFDYVTQNYSIKREQQIVYKEVYCVIWLVLIFSLLIGTYYGYKRKDYR
ncbi:ABC transporter permease [Ureaplasma urealyticum]|uniref:ABC transporter permease n=2 Tax=Ureaplasma urealyticum TaxID=2130 RepID=A0AAP9AC73_UREUR|nr:ABC transporter permease [Ureaplasma urealyticum]EDX54093.1 putative membrane protein [Ureaplasma urealyticum serovar 9 str. ATCC 33175]EDU06336.1 putative membrane protein [Ureaplasma urealyticum serovar 5 str. ATCC 27817]EEH01414.1 putative membrane protein [Ureaplasma urealyticum serovar 8 str. ATCC 27618]MCF1348783.1 ABC transporter permease [Ureaplasma urealyticum]QDI63480.1 ABC transporter permease [Ureaplasma urealyticum]